jgi:UDP-2,3-diacylglucosamine pyrophosphatase LpxH
MKTVIIGDVHGRDQWKQIVAQESDADRFVFLGDYFDSFDISSVEQMHNFKEIVEFKENIGEEVIMLIGNHDYHYFPEINDSSTSGYQTKMALVIKQLIGENRKHLQVAHRIGEFVFSHAGISSEWLDDTVTDWTEQNMVDKINELFKYTPLSLDYRSFKMFSATEWSGASGYGNETYQGPMWIRPKALMSANKDTLRKKIIQVVGHTYQNEIDKEGKATGGRYYFVDVQETSQEYMIITDGQISFNKIKK